MIKKSLSHKRKFSLNNSDFINTSFNNLNSSINNSNMRPSSPVSEIDYEEDNIKNTNFINNANEIKENQDKQDKDIEMQNIINEIDFDMDIDKDIDIDIDMNIDKDIDKDIDKIPEQTNVNLINERSFCNL